MSGITDNPVIAPELEGYLPDSYLYDGRFPIGKFIFPSHVLDAVRKFEVFPDDTIVVGYCKCGTTWLQEIVWLVQNAADTDKANLDCVWDRVPLIEQAPPHKPKPMLKYILDMERPRLYKTHLPFWFLEEEILANKPKVIYITRNPKDMLVSYWYFARKFYTNYLTSFDIWFKLFQEKKIQYGDLFDNIQSWLTLRDAPNFLMLHYEDLKADHRGAVVQISNFLGKHLSEDQINKIVDHTGFEQMKSNPATNLSRYEWMDNSECPFQRRGIVGDWSTMLSEEQNCWIEKACQQFAKETNFSFKFK